MKDVCNFMYVLNREALDRSLEINRHFGKKMAAGEITYVEYLRLCTETLRSEFPGESDPLIKIIHD